MSDLVPELFSFVSGVVQSEFSAVLAALFWSIAVILIRISGLQIAAVPLTFFKTFTALICFLLAIPLSGVSWWPPLSGWDHLRLFTSAVLGISIADTLFVAALRQLGASLQALADCIYPPSVALVGFLMFGEALGSWEVLGGGLVVLGVATGIGRSRHDAEGDLYQGVILAAAAHVVMAVGILMVRDIFREISVIWVSGYRFFLATIILGLYGVWRGDDLTVGFRRRDLYRWTIPMGILGPFMATMFWVGGFKYTTPGRAAIYNQLSTVFILVLARVFLGERLTPGRILGVGLAIAGAILVASH